MRRQRFNILILAMCFATFAFGQDVNGGGQDDTASAGQELSVKAIDVDVYPNPAVDFLVVQLSDSRESDNVKFQIRSLLGTEMIVTPENLGNGQFRFPVKDFATGYYFVIVEHDVSRFAIRWLKQ